MLGNIEDYGAAAAADVFTLKPKEGRIEAIRDALVAALQLRRVSHSLLLPLRGKLLHASYTMPLRVGRGILQGLNEAIEKREQWSPLLEMSIRFAIALLDLRLAKQIRWC